MGLQHRSFERTQFNPYMTQPKIFLIFLPPVLLSLANLVQVYPWTKRLEKRIMRKHSFATLKPKEELTNKASNSRPKFFRDTLIPIFKSCDLAVDYWKIAAITLLLSNVKKNYIQCGNKQGGFVAFKHRSGGAPGWLSRLSV